MYTIIKGPNVTWIDIINPNEDDIHYLKEHYSFHSFVLQELKRPEQYPRIERYDTYLFIILHYPVHFHERRETRARKIDFIVMQNTLITNHYGSALPLKSLLDACNLYEDSRKAYMSENAGYLLYHLLSNLWKNSVKKLDQINVRIDKIEAEIFAGKEREMVKEISFVKTDIINFWRILEPQGRVMEELTKEGVVFWGEPLEPYLEEAASTYAQAWDRLKMHRETILALEETNKSLLTTKSTEIIRVLTVFSVILLPLTLFASIWGMNTYYLPFRGIPFDFWIIFSLMATVATVMVIYFRKKGWL